jgi:hypothetical protein
VRKPLHYNYHLHLGFFEKACRWHGHKLIHYGPVSHARFDGPLPFDPGRNFGDVVRELKADAFMTMEWPMVDRAMAEVPSSIFKIAYIVDLYHMKSAERWQGSNVAIVRAKRFERTLRRLPGGKSIRAVQFFPFSFDADRAKKVKEPAEREAKVVFCGGRRPKLYPVRRAAINALKKARLLSKETRISPALAFGPYQAVLKSAEIALACTGVYRLNMAKHIEIPAAGTALMTDGAPGMDQLLPKGMYLQYTVDNVVEVARMALNDLPATREMAAAAKAHVYEHHNDQVRAGQIMTFLRRHGLKK